jgi:dCTP deaminase
MKSRNTHDELRAVAAIQPGELSDIEVVTLMLTRELFISPLLDVRQISGAVDLRLSSDFIVRRMDTLPYFDPLTFFEKQFVDPLAIWSYYERVVKPNPRDPFILHPGQFVLGSTLEHVAMGRDISGNLQGRSTLGRDGLSVHSTASFIHPGHNGNIVFELTNNGSHPIPLYPGTRVAQIRFTKLRYCQPVGYSQSEMAKYRDNIGTSFGRPWEDWEYAAIARLKREVYESGRAIG